MAMRKFERSFMLNPPHPRPAGFVKKGFGLESHQRIVDLPRKGDGAIPEQYVKKTTVDLPEPHPTTE
jgi:hypothetical protein